MNPSISTLRSQMQVLGLKRRIGVWWRRGLVSTVTGVVILLPAASSLAFSQAAATSGGSLPQSSYLIRILPSHVAGLVSAFGDRLYKPGNERVSLTGTYTDSSGTLPATMLTEIPDRVRISISGAQSKTLVFDGKQARANGTSPTEADQDVLESLQSDAAESFFYSFQRKAGRRFLGGRYQLDDGKNPAYRGPYYDIYALVQPVGVRAGGPIQQKLYYFDSVTGLFAKARYRIRRGGRIVDVETVFSNWTTTNGQSTPRRIERFEDGKSVFFLTVTAAQMSAAANDGAFNQH